MNVGERGESLAKLALIFWRDNNQFGIEKVGFGKTEYYSHRLTIARLKELSDSEIQSYCAACNIEKASSVQKADVFINDIAWSLKSEKGAMPALLNHTPRHGILKVCNRENIDIKKIDKLVKNYWTKRINGEIKEDVKFLGSVFAQDSAVMVKLLAYFLFKGSARGNSEFPANGLYKMEDPLDFGTWKKYDVITAAKNIIDDTVISMRNKGMMSSYTANSTNTNHIIMRPWVEFVDGKYKGSLHIRV